MLSGVASGGSTPLPFATGDVDGDGYADLAAGQPNLSRSTGAIQLYAGRTEGLNPSAYIALLGVDGENAGYGVSVAAGDYNGDARQDLAIGAMFVARETGRVHVYQGTAMGFASSPSLSLVGPLDRGTWFGRSVSGNVDTNGDGFADLVVGGSGTSTAAGVAAVYLGSETGLASLPSRQIAAPDGLLTGFGIVVAGAGDVDGDGYGEIVVAAPNVSSSTGRVYAYRGSTSGTLAPAAWVLNGPGGTGGAFGTALAAGTDFNADGYSDLLVGAPGVNGNRGAAYLFLGSTMGLAGSPSVVLASPVSEAARFGEAVSAVGDVDGDGYPDAVITAPNVSANTGAIWLMLGGPGGFTGPGIRIDSPRGPGERFGVTLARRRSVLRDCLG
jgi:hypothetical protein